MAESKTVKKETLPEDPMQIRVTKYIPKVPAGEQQSIYVCLNGKGYNIPRGKNVDMPLPVWEIIERAMNAEEKREADVREAATCSV